MKGESGGAWEGEAARREREWDRSRERWRERKRGRTEWWREQREKEQERDREREFLTVYFLALRTAADREGNFISSKYFEEKLMCNSINFTILTWYESSRQNSVLFSSSRLLSLLRMPWTAFLKGKKFGRFFFWDARLEWREHVWSWETHCLPDMAQTYPSHICKTSWSVWSDHIPMIAFM